MAEFARNRAATYHYDILETFEAGIVLSGSEVKSVRAGSVSLKGAYVTTRNGDFSLIGAHISPYKYAKNIGGEPTRPRTLLMKKREINQLRAKVESEGLTLIPLSLYSSAQRVKLSLGLARGKKLFNKKQSIKKREVERTISRALKTRG